MDEYHYWNMIVMLWNSVTIVLILVVKTSYGDGDMINCYLAIAEINNS